MVDLTGNALRFEGEDLRHGPNYHPSHQWPCSPGRKVRGYQYNLQITKRSFSAFVYIEIYRNSWQSLAIVSGLLCEAF